MDAAQLLSVREVARELRCSSDTVRRAIRAGELSALQFGGPGRSLRIPVRDLDRWLGSAPEPGVSDERNG